MPFFSARKLDAEDGAAPCKQRELHVRLMAHELVAGLLLFGALVAMLEDRRPIRGAIEAPGGVRVMRPRRRSHISL
ncbi:MULTISPECIES: hypothetical protein [unclassified Caballeronia]|uniref:hypothetical protein n=1 Tax=unclassified Caballeronia TaxID=2646786 RepID=UPI00202911E9|nr:MULTISPECIES: hypothetical protein [unclassified Caballeronia]